MTRIDVRHTAECRISHPRDVDCAEAAWIRHSAARAARRECAEAPSRTQPFHAFDIHASGGECEHCGTPWDPSRDGADDV
jgi:hypothetical protein